TSQPTSPLTDLPTHLLTLPPTIPPPSHHPPSHLQPIYQKTSPSFLTPTPHLLQPAYAVQTSPLTSLNTHYPSLHPPSATPPIFQPSIKHNPPHPPPLTPTTDLMS